MSKYILFLTLTIFSFAIQAKEFPITQMKNMSGFDGIFILTNGSSNQGEVHLDCQSYFQKLDFYDEKSQLLFENYISLSECEYLYKNFSNCLQKEKIKCIDSDDIFNENCQCQ